MTITARVRGFDDLSVVAGRAPRVVGVDQRRLEHRVELPGRGTTRVWQYPGPPGAATLMLIHGVTFTAELNWREVMAPLGRYFRVVAFDQRGHGSDTRTG